MKLNATLSSPRRNQMGHRNRVLPQSWLALAGLLCMLSTGIALLPSGGFEDGPLTEQWGLPVDIVQEAEEQMEGDYSLRFLRTGYATSPEIIEVEPDRNYTLRASLKIPEQQMAAESADYYVVIRLLLYDADGKEISPCSVHAFPETQTTLAKAVQEGALSVFLAGDAWEKLNATLIAFGASQDLSDLPNPEVVDIVDIVPGNEGGFEVRLAAPLAQSYEAGTPVRMHRIAPFPMIVADPSSEWTEYALDLTGSSEPGEISNNQLWHGTRFVRVQIKPISKELSNPTLPIDLLVDGVYFGP